MKVFQGDTYDELLNRLVSYYKFSDVTDYFGANHLTNNNGVLFQAGHIGNAAKFDGATNYLQLASPLSTDTTFISIFGWVFVPTVNEQGAFFMISSGGATGYALGVGGTQLINNGNNLIGYLPGIVWMNFNKAIGTGWHSVCMTRGATTWRGYVDGVVSATTFVNNPGAIGAGTTTFGSFPSGSGGFWKDKLDEWGFWRRELTQTEITFLHNAGVGKTMIDSNPLPTVPTTAIAATFSQNHATWYGGANRTFDVQFPAATLTVLAEVWDRVASGMNFQKAAEDAYYIVLTPNLIRIAFHAEHNAGASADAYGLRFAYPSAWPEVPPVDHSNEYNGAIGAGKSYYQTYKFTIDLTVDVSTLGLPTRNRKHRGGELWGIIPEVANYLG